MLPLWQLAQFPITPEWSNLAPLQLIVLWQSAQSFEAGGCPGDLPGAATPLWQETHVASTSR